MVRTDDLPVALLAFLAFVVMSPIWVRYAQAFTAARREDSSLSALLLPAAPERVEILSLPDDSRDGERIAQVVDIPWPAGDGLLRLANIHLTHLPDGEALRARQMAELLDHLDSLSPVRATVVAGDLNAGPGAGCLAALAARATPLTRARTVAEGRAALDHLALLDPAATGPALSPPVVALDEPETVAEAAVLPSDHYAVAAVLSPTRRGA